MTHEEVLQWLNERTGREVHVDVSIDQGDRRIPLLGMEGNLRSGGAELRGWFLVGAALLDLTDIRRSSTPFIVHERDHNEIEISFGNGTRLRIFETVDFRTPDS